MNVEFDRLAPSGDDGFVEQMPLEKDVAQLQASRPAIAAGSGAKECADGFGGGRAGNGDNGDPPRTRRCLDCRRRGHFGSAVSEL